MNIEYLNLLGANDQNIKINLKIIIGSLNAYTFKLTIQKPNKRKNMTNSNDLEKQRADLLLRIQKLEKDLEKPVNKDLDEAAMDMKNREILYGLYNVEKKNLLRIEEELLSINKEE